MFILLLCIYLTAKPELAGSGNWRGRAAEILLRGELLPEYRFWHTCEIRLRATRGFTQISLSAYIASLTRIFIDTYHNCFAAGSDIYILPNI